MIVNKLSKRYLTDNGEKIIFENFSTSFADGKVTVVMGESGVGKTTLLNCIANLTDFEGEIVGADSVSYVFQDDRLILDKTIYKNIEFVLLQKDKKEREKRIKKSLEMTELLDQSCKFPSELSGGQRKRASLARAFASDRQIILLDEPLSSLDVGLKFRIYDVMKKLFKAENKTVIMVTHDIDEALTLADEIIYIDNGGTRYRKQITTDVFSRDIVGQECNAVRKDLIDIFKNLRK